MMTQKKAFTSSDHIVLFVAPAFWRVFIMFLSSFGELSYYTKKAGKRADKHELSDIFM
jgi:hypothetical protein